MNTLVYGSTNTTGKKPESIIQKEFIHEIAINIKNKFFFTAVNVERVICVVKRI